MSPIMLANAETSQKKATPKGYNYSHVGLGRLGASEYTLVTMAVDCSGSVSHRFSMIEKALGVILKACEKAPRKDNLLIRLIVFSDNVTEVHGFRLRNDIKPIEYDGCLSVPGSGGSTSLYEGCLNAIEAISDFSKTLADQSYLANGLLVVLTDGEDNRGHYSGLTPAKIKTAVQSIRRSETLESLTSILIGVDNSSGNAVETDLSKYLEDFKNEAGFDQYEWAGKLDDKSMAKIANFISQSISSSSAALSTGGPSQPVTF